MNEREKVMYQLVALLVYSLEKQRAERKEKKQMICMHLPSIRCPNCQPYFEREQLAVSTVIGQCRHGNNLASCSECRGNPLLGEINKMIKEKIMTKTPDYKLIQAKAELASTLRSTIELLRKGGSFKIVTGELSKGEVVEIQDAAACNAIARSLLAAVQQLDKEIVELTGLGLQARG